jgi:hypothetical protein
MAPKTSPQPPLFLFFIDFAFILGSQKGVVAWDCRTPVRS